jgi:hypothetical protein
LTDFQKREDLILEALHEANQRVKALEMENTALLNRLLELMESDEGVRV